MDNGNKDDGYEIGYGKPPRGTQFQKGRSGNFRGRPRGSKNVATVLWDALLERVEVQVDGKVKRITKLEAAATQLSNRAAKGELRAVKLLMEDIVGLDNQTGEFAPRRGLSSETVDALIRKLSSGVNQDGKN